LTNLHFTQIFYVAQSACRRKDERYKSSFTRDRIRFLALSFIQHTITQSLVSSRVYSVNPAALNSPLIMRPLHSHSLKYYDMEL
jgi:hypothetical protein